MKHFVDWCWRKFNPSSPAIMYMGSCSCFESVLCYIETLKCVLAVPRLSLAVHSMAQKFRLKIWSSLFFFFFCIKFFFVGIWCSGLFNFDIVEIFLSNAWTQQQPKQNAKFAGKVFYCSQDFFNFMLYRVFIDWSGSDLLKVTNWEGCWQGRLVSF